MFYALITTPTPSYKSTDEKSEYTLRGYCNAALWKNITGPYDGRFDFIIFSRYEDVVHSLHWGAHKLRRVAHSSAAAKILVAAKTTDSYSFLQQSLKEFYYTHPTDITTDSKITFVLFTLIRKPSEYLHMVAHATIKEAFRSLLRSPGQRCPESHHAADALTKNNRTVMSHLHSSYAMATIQEIHPRSCAFPKISPSSCPSQQCCRHLVSYTRELP